MLVDERAAPRRAPAKASQPHGEILHAAWLSSDLLLLTATLPVEALVVTGAHLAPKSDHAAFDVRCMRCGADASGTSLAVMTMRFRSRPPARARWGRLVLSTNSGLVGMEPPQLADAVTDLSTLLRESLARKSPDCRAELLAFLTQASEARGDIGLSKSLHAAREVLRERLRVSAPAPDSGHGVWGDSLFAIDETLFYAQGWLWDGDAPVRRLTAISPEGCRVELLDRIFRHGRSDVSDFYAASFGTHAEERSGFICSFPTSIPSPLVSGWVLEMETGLDDEIEVGVPPVVWDPRRVREKIVTDLIHDPDPDGPLRLGHAYPSLMRLQERSRASVAIAEVTQHGRPPVHPSASIVVPLYGRIDFVVHQLAQFALDPEMRDSDLIYVLDSPELAGEFRTSAARTSRLYEVPFRTVILNQNGGYAVANNLGATLARARRLLLLNSDVLPDKPGWLSTMTAFYDTTPRIGALGCKLLYEDDSLQHAGMYFERFADGPQWYNGHYFKGLHRTLPAANAARCVPAVTGACMMLGTALFESAGGLSACYLQGDYEDSDLCLRLAAAGRENWYTPNVEMFHLEGQSYPSSQRRLFSDYNRWLHTRLWDAQITETMRDFTASSSESANGVRAAASRRRRI